jgi:hypothetical protein
MKNYLLLTASAVLVLSSCSNNEIVENYDLQKDGPKKMSFSTYVPGATRALFEAGQADLDTLNNQGFQLVTSYVEDGERYTTAGSMKKLENVWSMVDNIEGVQTVIDLTWPASDNQKVGFYAFYPESAKTVTIEQNGEDVTTEAFSFDDPVSASNDAYLLVDPSKAEFARTDYMVAQSSSSYSETTDGNVQLDFTHILGQVDVRIVCTDARYNFEVGNVVLTAPNAQGYKFANGNTPGEFYLGTLENEGVSYTLDEIGISSGYFDEQGNHIHGNTVPVVADITKTSSEQNYGSLMVVPGLCQISLCYRGTSKDKTESEVVGTQYTEWNSVEFDVVRAHKSVVVIKLDPDVHSMTFSVEVENWTEETPVTLDEMN